MKRKVFGGVVGLLVVELALKSDEQISWNAEAELDAKGDGGADALFLANHVAKLGFAKVHGGGGGNLGDTVMGDGVPDEGGGRIGNGLGDFERVPWDGGWVQFHFPLVSVDILDSDEFDVFHFRVFPLEGDTPRGFAGIGINGVF